MRSVRNVRGRRIDRRRADDLARESSLRTILHFRKLSEVFLQDPFHAPSEVHHKNCRVRASATSQLLAEGPQVVVGYEEHGLAMDRSAADEAHHAVPNAHQAHPSLSVGLSVT